MLWKKILHLPCGSAPNPNLTSLKLQYFHLERKCSHQLFCTCVPLVLASPLFPLFFQGWNNTVEFPNIPLQESPSTLAEIHLTRPLTAAGVYSHHLPLFIIQHVGVIIIFREQSHWDAAVCRQVARVKRRITQMDTWGMSLWGFFFVSIFISGAAAQTVCHSLMLLLTGELSFKQQAKNWWLDWNYHPHPESTWRLWVSSFLSPSCHSIFFLFL